MDQSHYIWRKQFRKIRVGWIKARGSYHRNKSTRECFWKQVVCNGDITKLIRVQRCREMAAYDYGDIYAWNQKTEIYIHNEKCNGNVGAGWLNNMTREASENTHANEIIKLCWWKRFSTMKIK